MSRRNHSVDAERLANSHSKFVGKFRRSSGTEHAAAFAGHVVGGVDGFLHVATSFFKNLAHLASHVAGIFFFAFHQHLGGAVDDLGAAGSGNLTPFGEGTLGGVNGSIDIGFRRFLEDAHHFANGGRIAVFESVASGSFHPFAVYEVLISLGAGRGPEQGRAGEDIGGHRVSLRYLCYSPMGPQRQSAAISCLGTYLYGGWSGWARTCKSLAGGLKLRRGSARFTWFAAYFSHLSPERP